ncbi:MAG: WD40 repeat domain-containing protein, partial [Pseudomonadota bacterium]|nr:WD40 repeat domain-containing protein [Pseudomonadota bacterium]
ADARGGQDGRRNARLKLIAGLIGVGLDELKQRERQRQILQRIAVSAAVLCFTLLAMFGWRWQQSEKQQALDAQALKVRIEQLYDNGRQELLAHNEARAAVYLNEAYKLGVDTPALRYMLARAMRVVDAQSSRLDVGSPIYLAALNADGTRFLTVDGQYRLRVWNAGTGALLATYVIGDTTTYFFAEFSADGQLVWIQSDHSDEPIHRLRIVSAETEKVLASANPGHIQTDAVLPPLDEQSQHFAYLNPDYSIGIRSLLAAEEHRIPGRYSAVRFCNDGRSVMAGTADGTVHLLDRLSGRSIRKFTGLRGTVVALDSSAGCRTLAAGTSQGAVRVWNIERGDVLMTGGHAQAIASVQMNAAGTRVMSATRGGANIWDGETGALLYANKFSDPYNTIAGMSPDGQHLVSLSSSQLSFVHATSADTLYSLDGHHGVALTFNFSANGRKLITGGSDGMAVIWNVPQSSIADFHLGALKDQRLLSEFHPPEGQVLFNRAGSQLVVGGADGVVGAWDSRLLKSDTRFVGHQAPLSAMSFSPDGDVLATGGWDQSLRFWDTGSGASLRHLDQLGGNILRLSFDSKGSHIGVAIQGHGTMLRTVSSGALQAEFETDYARAQSFSPMDSTFAVGISGVAKLWDLLRREFRWSVPLSASGDAGAAPGIAVIAFSPDGERILATVAEQKAFVLDAQTGSILHRFDEPSASGLYTAAFSPDGHTIALGDRGKSVFLWTPDAAKVLTLPGHAAQVKSVSFSPDGALLVSAAADGRLKVWDVNRGQLLDSIAAHDGAVSWDGAQFSPNGNHILSSGVDNVARLWGAQKESRSPELVAAALRCQVAWRANGVSLVSEPDEARGCVSP